MDDDLEKIFLKVKPKVVWPGEEDLDKNRVQTLADLIDSKIKGWIYTPEAENCHSVDIHNCNLSPGFFTVEGFTSMDCRGVYVEDAWKLIKDNFKGKKYYVVLNNVHYEDESFTMNFYIAPLVK